MSNPNLTYTKPTFTYEKLPTTYTVPTTYNTANIFKPLTLEQQRYVADYKRKLEKQNEEWAKLEAKAKRTVNSTDKNQLNSVADVIGTALAGTRYDNESKFVKWLYSNGVHWNPIKNIVAGAANLFTINKQFVADPILKGEWGTAALNLLQGGMECLDVLANPVKGAIIESVNGAKENGFIGWSEGFAEGFAKGLGYGENFTPGAKERQTYNYDTGSKTADFILELASDPGVWGSLGVTGFIKGAGTGVGKELVSEGTEGLLKEVVEASGEKSVRKWLSGVSGRAIRNELYGTPITKDAIIKDLLYKAPRRLSKEALEKVNAETVSEIADVVMQMSKTQASNLSEKTAFNIIKSIDSLDNTIAKATFIPIWGPFRVAKRLYNIQNSRVLRIAEPYIQNKETLSAMDFEAVMAKAGEVNESLVELAKEQGLKGFSNATLQKAFYRSGTKDVQHLQGLVRGLNKSNPNFENYEFAIRSYLNEAHGISKELTTKEMLIELAGAYKKAEGITDMFADLHQGMTDIIRTYTIIEAAKPYYDLLNKGVLNKDAVEKVVQTLTKVTKESAEAYAKQQNISLDAALTELTRKSAFVDASKISTTIDDIYDTIYTVTTESVLNAIKALDPELFEIAEYSATHNDFIKKLTDMIYVYLKQSPEAKAAEEYLNILLPEGKKIKNLIPNSFLYTKENIAQHLTDALLNPIARAAGFDNSKVFRTSYLNPKFKYDLDLDTVDIYKLPAEKAAELTRLRNAKAISDVYESVYRFAEKTVGTLQSPIQKKRFALEPDDYFTDAAATINKQYKDLMDKFIANNDDFQKYIKETLGQSKQLSDTINNIYSLGKSIIKSGYSTTEARVTELIKSFDNKYLTKTSIEDFKISAANVKDELEALLESYENTSLDAVISFAQDVELPLTDALRNAVADLEVILKADTIDVRAFNDIIDTLDNSLKANRNAIKETAAKGIQTKDIIKHRAYSAGNYTEYVFTDKAYGKKKREIAQLLKQEQGLISEELRLAEQEAELGYRTASFKERISNPRYINLAQTRKKTSLVDRLSELTQHQKTLLESEATCKEWLKNPKARPKYVDKEAVKENLFNIRQALNKTEESLKHTKELLKHTEARLKEIKASKKIVSDKLKNIVGTLESYSQLGVLKKVTNYATDGKVLMRSKLKVTDVFNKLETLVDNSRALIEIKPPEFAVTGDVVWYALKQEQTTNSIAYIQDELIFKFACDVYTGSADLPQVLQEYLNEDYIESLIKNAPSEEARANIADMAEGVRLIVKGSKSIVSYARLLDTIENCSTISKALKEALISSLNSIPVARMSVEKIALNPDDMFDVLSKGIENYINAKRKTSKYTLDYFRAVCSEKKVFEKITGLDTKSWESLAHGSAADTIVDKEYVKEVLPDFKLRDNDVFYDIEATGVNKFNSEVREISYNTKDGIVTFKRVLNAETDITARPSNSLLDIYANGETNRAVVRDRFYNYHSADYTGPEVADKVILCQNEKDLLQQATDFLYANSALYRTSEGVIDATHPEASRLIGHNTNSFDMPFLRRRAEECGVKNFERAWGRLEHIDSYKLTQEKYNFYEMGLDDQTAIKDLMSTYIKQRTMLDSLGNGLLHAQEDFINAIPTQLAEGLKTVIRAMPTSALDEAASADSLAYAEAKRSLQFLSTHLGAVRKNSIKDVNQALRKYIFSAEELNTPAFKEAFIKILKTSEQYKDWTEAELKDYVRYLNPSKALYAENNPFNMVGFKKVFDPATVRAWFDYAPTSVPQQQGKQMYVIANNLNKNLARIKNPKAILPFEKTIDDFLNAVAEKKLLIPNNEGLSYLNIRLGVYQYLIKNTDAISEKYVLAQHLHNILQYYGQSGGQNLLKMLPDAIVKNMEDVMSNEKLFTHATIRDTGHTFAELDKLMLEDEVWQTVEGFKSVVEDFNHKISEFDLCDALDKTGLFAPEKQAFSQSARATLKLLSDYITLIDGATVPQLYDAQSKLKELSDLLSKQTLYNTLQYNTPEDLIKTLAWSNGVTTFATVDAPELAVKLIKDTALLEKAGVKVVTEGEHRLWLVLNTKDFKYTCNIKNVDGVAIREIQFNGVNISKPVFKELDIDYAIKACKKSRDMSDINGVSGSGGVLNDTAFDKLGANIKETRKALIHSTNGAFTGLHTEVMHKAQLRNIYNRAPDAVKELLGDFELRMNEPTWFSETQFNLSNLGTAAARRQILTSIPDNLMHSYKLTTELVLDNQATRFKYMDMLLNSEMRLDVGAWADVTRDTEILKHLKDHPELTVGIVQKAKGDSLKPQLRRIAINTVEDLHNARRLRAVIFSNETFSRVAAVVNDSAYDTGVLRMIANTSRIYKIGQLSTPGVLMRNAIDSVLKMYTTTGSIIETFRAIKGARASYKEYNTALKGMLATADLNLGVIEDIARTYGVTPKDVLNDILLETQLYKKQAIEEFINAEVLFNKYNTAVEDIIKMDSNAVMRPENVEFYFKYMTDGESIDMETFYEVHKFITQGASAGMSPILKKAFMKTSDQTTRELLDEGNYKEAYEEFASARHLEGTSDTITYALSKLSTPNSHIEQIVRLAQHMQQMRTGMNFAQSNWKIAKTHFDYATKTDITRSIELIFPYYNFKIKNFEFWATLMENQPWMLRGLSEIMEQVYDFDEYDTYEEHLELANNESLQYQILAGNIPLFDTNVVLKVNPSFTDAFNTVTNPLGTVESSLFAPFNAGFKAMMLEAYKQDLTNEFINNTFGLNDYAVTGQASAQQQALNNLPLIGPFIQKVTQQGPKYAERTDFLLAHHMPSTFGATSRWDLSNIKNPEEWDAIKDGWVRNIIAKQMAYNAKYSKKGYKKKAYAKKAYARKSYARKSYAKKSYSKKAYTNYNPSYSRYTAYYSKPYSRYGEASFIHSSKMERPKRFYPENIYWKYYTKTGKKRWDILKAKSTQKNLQMKIKLMYDYYR